MNQKTEEFGWWIKIVQLFNPQSGIIPRKGDFVE